jgi:hypothetical protein
MAETDSQQIGVYGSGSQTTATGKPVSVQFANKDNFTYIVHGALGKNSNSSWWRRTGGFASAVETNHPGVWRCGNTQIVEYSWSGEDTHTARVEGGSRLAQHIKNLQKHKQEKDISYANIDIIAHGHGGNVVLEALKTLAGEGNSVNSVVLIATPHIKIKYQDPPDVNPRSRSRATVWYEWMYFKPEVFDAVSGDFNNIYSQEDAIQVYRVDAMNGIPRDQIPDNEHYKDMIISRAYTGQGFENLVNIPQNTDVGSINAHVVMHSKAMGKAIGRLLEGSSWIAAREQTGLPDVIVDDSDTGE